MKKGGRIITTIVLIAILLGAVCVGVGLITGGDMGRVLTAFDERYHPAVYYNYVLEVIKVIGEAIQSSFA